MTTQHTPTPWRACEGWDESVVIDKTTRGEEMGNRAVLAFSENKNSVGVYLHWAGDRDSVEKILQMCRERGYRTPASDPAYAMARLVEACCEAEGAHRETGCGVGTIQHLDCDNGDNGLYIIGGDWQIKSRKFNRETQ